MIGAQIILHSTSLICCEIFYRFFVAIYEYFINWKHYEPKHRIFKVFKYSIYKFDSKMYGGLCILTILFLIIQGHDKNALNFVLKNFKELAIPYSFLRLLNFTMSNVELARWIRGNYGLDYATGMASNYFHGYLHLNLPTTGHTTKGLVERIIDYEATEKVIIPVKKLFILIPHSMFTKPKIESKIMTAAKHLETVTLDRAAVKRPFKNAVYRIEKCRSNKDMYVVLEGATPMNSFYEVLNYRATCTTEMLDMKKEITLKFYRALKKIVEECPDTKSLVELVYYNDVTAEGKDVDVGEIVRERINLLIERDQIEVECGF